MTDVKLMAKGKVFRTMTFNISQPAKTVLALSPMHQQDTQPTVLGITIGVEMNNQFNQDVRPLRAYVSEGFKTGGIAMVADNIDGIAAAILNYLRLEYKQGDIDLQISAENGDGVMIQDQRIPVPE